MCRQGVSKSFRVLEKCFWNIEGAEHLMILTPIFEGVNTVLVRVRIFNSTILNLENTFFVVLRKFSQCVLEVLEFFKGVR